MAFFAEDVHLLASVSVEGRLFVCKISEGPDEEGTPQITGKIVMAIQIVGEREAVHPRVWQYCHKQEVLVVRVGKHFYKLLLLKLQRVKLLLKLQRVKSLLLRILLSVLLKNLLMGSNLLVNMMGEVTDLSMCQWMTTWLVSASMDGTIKIWEDSKSQPLLVLRPYDGLPVYSSTFVTVPNRPNHIMLITVGPLNREVKI